MNTRLEPMGDVIMYVRNALLLVAVDVYTSERGPEDKQTSFETT